MTHDTWHPPNLPPHTHTHTPPRIWGDVKKTSPKKLHPMAHTDKQTNRQTNMLTDMVTLWLNRPSGPIQWKGLGIQQYLVCMLNRVLTALDKSSKGDVKAVIVSLVDWSKPFRDNVQSVQAPGLVLSFLIRWFGYVLKTWSCFLFSVLLYCNLKEGKNRHS